MYVTVSFHISNTDFILLLLPEVNPAKSSWKVTISNTITLVWELFTMTFLGENPKEALRLCDHDTGNMSVNVNME